MTYAMFMVGVVFGALIGVWTTRSNVENCQIGCASNGMACWSATTGPDYCVPVAK